MDDAWAWLTLAGLGAFHGINPAMGWLFAVALGLQDRSRMSVFKSLVPIALGHALSVGIVVGIVWALPTFIDLKILTTAAAVVLILFGIYRILKRHKARVGYRVDFKDMTIWSFLMATGHGAGLMLVPVILRMPSATTAAADHAGHGAHAGHGGGGGGHEGHMVAGAADSIGVALAAVGIHTLAMLVATGVIAVIVYEWVGVAFLRRGWLNLDKLWSVALILAGGILLVLGLV